MTIDERHYDFEMDEAEKQEFIAAVEIKVGPEKAEAFVDKYHSDDNGYSAEDQDDDLGFLFDALYVWESARYHFTKTAKDSNR